jgi:hypothetical protein
LLVVAGRLATWLPVLLLLHSQIPYKPGVATVPGQRCGLLTGGKQSKPAHSRNITTTTDNEPKGEKRCFFPWLKPRVSTPRTS